MIIGPYVITSNSYSAYQRASVYVKRDGVVLCRLYCGDTNDPLGKIQKYPKNEYRQEFIDQLLSNNVPAVDVEMLLKPQPSRYFINKMKKAGLS